MLKEQAPGGSEECRPGAFLVFVFLGLCAEKLVSTGLSTASGQLAQFSWAA